MEGDIPVIDVKQFLEGSNPEKAKEECQKVIDSFHNYGIIIIKDPRINEQDNWEYIDLIEKYYDDTSRRFYNGEKIEEIRPDIHYQAGATPEFVEKARTHCERFEKMDPINKPLSECPPELDAKWRYFWRIGERNAEATEVDPPQLKPAGFPDWEEKMNKWGNLMLSACETVAEMAAIGYGADRKLFVEKMKWGPHLLAPTGSDLVKFDVGTTFAGVHYDLNFLTIHGKSRYPGLFVWLRTGKRVPVKVPDGCLLIQAGIQFEILTGGHVIAGFHEVIYTEATKKIVESVKQQMQETGEHKALWRVSSTLFSHINSSVMLYPLENLKAYHQENALTKYPAIKTRDQVLNELKMINLAQPSL